MKKASPFAAAFVCLLSLPQFVAAQTDPSGDWDITLNSPMGVRNFKAILRQDGQKPSCALKRDVGDVPCDAAIDGRQIKIKYKVTIQENELAVTLTGTVDGDTAKGDANFGGLAQGDWSAKRSAPALAAAAHSAVGIDGDWDLSINSPQGTRNVRASFTREGETLKGFFISPNGHLPLTGSIRKNDLNFSFTIKYEGNDFGINQGI